MPTVAVIGKGLFGVAAARHLVAAGWDTTVIGPDEPAAGSSYEGPYAAHFDEARIMVARGSLEEIELTVRSISGVLDLQAATGTLLLTQSGSIEVLQRGAGSAMVDGVVCVGVGAEILEAAPPQGYYNPRAYVKAGVAEVVGRGGAQIAEPAAELAKSGAEWIVTTQSGAMLVADRIVVACGAWSNRFLPRPLALRLKREHVLFARLSPAVASAISMRPAVFHGATGNVEDIYTLPPLRYPDGSWYLKLGANTLHDREVQPDEIDDWYRGGDSAVAQDDLVAAFHTVFPSVAVESFHTERCVITYSAHDRPYIDEVDDGLVVATAGNGHGASWADGAGRLAAALVEGEEWNGFARTSFGAVYADGHGGWDRPLLLADRRGAAGV